MWYEQFPQLHDDDVRRVLAASMIGAAAKHRPGARWIDPISETKGAIMSTITPSNVTPPARPRVPLTPEAAYRWAWRIWVALPIVPSFLAVYAIWTITRAATPGDDALARAWCVGTLVYLALAIPAAFFWRGHLFRGYATGDAVPPGNYLLGMSAVWFSMASIGLLTALGCLVSKTLVPNLVIGVIVLLVYWTIWPTGEALARRTGSPDDPEKSQEPR
jgi:hypothetical protein